MPTPFTHLEIAQRLLDDSSIAAPVRAELMRERGAYLLGSVAADARVGSGMPREHTHFYHYSRPITENPWRVMVNQHPRLLRPHSGAQRAFVAGYVAHLSVDEIWSLRMVGPQFAAREWADRAFRFYMLHMILIYMDERDYTRLCDWQPDALASAQPDGWLPFIGDDDLAAWQRLIHTQIKPDGSSQTFEIFGGRIGKDPDEMRDFLHDEGAMQSGLWDHVTPETLAQVEAEAYRHARSQMVVYLRETSPESV